jgi:hypothetical protein
MICLGPARYEVDGVSMAPGLLPGDIVATAWLPGLDGWRPPRRFDRWIVAAPEAGVALKRVVGLPGETVAIRDGDLAVAGRVVLKPPTVLAEVAVETPLPDGAGELRHLRLPRREVLDDVPFATEVNRPLERVRDGGLVAIVTAGRTPARLTIGVDETRITWRLPAGRRGCFVAGRLDGHVVAVGWQLASDAAADRGCMPPTNVGTWSLATPCDGDDTLAPALAFDLDDEQARVERLSGWRDIRYEPANDGPATWTLGPQDHLLLGDFPTGSRDSRHWGPLPRASLLHRIVTSR